MKIVVIGGSGFFFPARRNEDDGCQLVEEAVRGVHFPPVRARDNPRRRGVPAENRPATRPGDGRAATPLDGVYKGWLAAFVVAFVVLGYLSVRSVTVWGQFDGGCRFRGADRGTVVAPACGPSCTSCSSC